MLPMTRPANFFISFCAIVRRGPISWRICRLCSDRHLLLSILCCSSHIACRHVLSCLHPHFLSYYYCGLLAFT
ncbi:uncharacterized protein CC84DRAFT_861506 [Paraphaeosphaeria sporulosa]|uniref:Uncharacterized protein n=1 Tax=Paraphaeosphaeria sporulosa TaxID=1460663 RepID=A0A177CA39_9PLEO|nr:uncharacterized protein CC84DRAFT_861506 [Paraphaeosphaeria sporulosa]OAG03638.1 hypothetical protein CC84DRAFT_861506 [Paraphaeosphaeria sporulosa]